MRVGVLGGAGHLLIPTPPTATAAPGGRGSEAGQQLHWLKQRGFVGARLVSFKLYKIRWEEGAAQVNWVQRSEPLLPAQPRHGARPRARSARERRTEALPPVHGS